MSGAVPILGHGPAFERERLAFLCRIASEVDHIARMVFITRDVVIVNSPSAIHEVLVSKAKSFEKSPLMRLALYPLAGEGLFTSGGALWRRQRRLMAPVFHPAKIDPFAEAMVGCAQHTCAAWQDGSTIDIAHETTRIAMAVAGRTLFGIDTSSEADTIGEALSVALHWTDATASRSLAALLQIEVQLALDRVAQRPNGKQQMASRMAARLEPPILWPTPRNRKLRHAISLLDERVQRMIDERRRSVEIKQDLLSRLLQARDEDDGAAMSDKQLRDEILTLFVAGHETTANGLAWSLYSLARNPDLYARARAAVDALGGRVPSLMDLQALRFLSCVFKEALRLYPPVYLFGRSASEDVSVAGYNLPRQCIVLVSPWSLQRRPDLWRDPTRFDPDRFAEHNDASRPRDAWIPFSDGPRICIGEHFAMLEAPLVLATLLQHADFELASSDPIGPEEAATLRPKGGVPARVRLRARA